MTWQRLTLVYLFLRLLYFYNIYLVVYSQLTRVLAKKSLDLNRSMFLLFTLFPMTFIFREIINFIQTASRAYPHQIVGFDFIHKIGIALRAYGPRTILKCKSSILIIFFFLLISLLSPRKWYINICLLYLYEKKCL